MSNVLEYQLRLADAAFTGPLGRARDQTGRFQRELGGLGAQAGSVSSLGSAFTGLAAKIGAAFTAYKAGEAVLGSLGKGLKLAADAETTATAFKTMLGSADAAAKTLAQLKELAAETPFEFPELAHAGRMLLAFGESADDIPATLRSIGDVASAVNAPIGDIAEIYGKARTAGTLFSEDINQLTGRGIPIIRELARVLGQPEGAIKKLAEEGKITFPLLQQAFQYLTSNGGQFFGMMAQQSATTNGLLSTLQDAVGELYLEFGKPLNEAIKPLLKDALDLAGQLKPLVMDLGQDMARFVGAARDFVAEAGDSAGVASALGSALVEAISSAWTKSMIPFKAAWAGMSSLGADLITWLTPVGEWLGATLVSKAQLFGAEITRGLADALDNVPLMGDAAGAARDKAAELQGAGEQSAGFARRAYDEAKAGTSPESFLGSLEGAMQATRDSFSGQISAETPPTASAGPALPKSVLDEDYNPLFPGGVLPPGVKGLKDTLPPSPLAPEGLPWAPPPGLRLPDTLPSTGLPGADARAKMEAFPGFAPLDLAPQVPSPGAAVRSQQQRDAATDAARSSGGATGSSGHPLAAVLKDIQTKLNSLAVAT